MTTTCAKCSEAKEASDFYPSALRTGKRIWCKSCHRDYYREKVAANPRYFLEYQLRSRAKKRAAVTALKVAAGCADCGEAHPACLEYHHRDPSEKVIEVVKLVDQNTKWNKLEAEIAKCIVLCANCHRKRHFTERAAEKAARSA